MLFFKKKERVEEIKPKEIKKEEESKTKEGIKKVPVFVRLERYDEILAALEELKITLQNLFHTISVLHEIEKIRRENLSLVEKGLNKLDERVKYFVSQFTKPSLPKMKLEDDELEKIEESVNRLRNSLEKIRSELKTEIE